MALPKDPPALYSRWGIVVMTLSSLYDSVGVAEYLWSSNMAFVKVADVSCIYLEFQPMPSTQKVSSLSIERHFVVVESHEG